MFRRVREFALDILQQADLLLLALCCGTTLFGVVMIASATNYMGTPRYVIVQFCAMVLGVGLYFLISMLDMGEVVKKWKWIILFNVLFILLLKTPFGVDDGTGNRAWLKFPFLPVSIQPAEIVKMTFVLLLAKQLTWLKEERDLRSTGSVFMLAAHLLFMVGLYYVISGDMGSALVYIFIFVCMCFAARVATRWFVIGGVGGVFAFYLLWELDFISGYMKDRFLTLFNHNLDPQGVSWHQNRSLLALGGGKLFGQGLFQGTQTQSEQSWSLPARHTDFIFSVIGEELGMVGCLLVIGLLTAIVVRCLVIAKNAKSRLDSYICVGIAGMLIFQMIINIGMCLYIMPVIGLTLPFISYGGSSIVTLFGAMGMVSGVQKRSRPEWLRQ